MKKLLLTLSAAALSLFLPEQSAFAQTYTMGTAPAGNNSTVNTCSGTFLDPGGTGAYGNSANQTVTFCPSTPGQGIQINFTAFNTESGFDFINVYSGIGTATLLFGPYSGATMPAPTTYQSVAANGCITITFTSDGSVTAAGWSATLSCFTMPSCTDGIQNGNETGVDCGGCSGCPPCSGTNNNATVTAASNIYTLPCGGGNVNLSAVGTSTTPVLGSNFNAGNAGAGWSASPAGVFNNPCGAGPNGAHMWMGNTTAAPRTLLTNSLDVRCGGQICFYLRYSIQGGAGSCEGPDEPDEGVNLQYSTNCGTTWTTIAYFHPNGTIIASNPGTNSPSQTGNTAFTTWANYCFNIPAGASTATTQFRWYQSGSSGSCCDHWGIDEVTITANPCLPYYYDWLHVAGAPNSANVTTNVTSTTTYTVLYTNGVDDTASANVTIVVNGPGTPTATTTTEPCLGSNQGTATISVTGGTPPFTYSITGPTSASNGTGVFNNLPPGNYTITVTQGGGCSSNGAFTIVPGPVCCAATASVANNVTCFGACNGTLTANPSGGVPPYTYVWFSGAVPIGQTTQSASGLCAGNYTVQVTDNTGCVITANGAVTQPTALGGTATPTAVTCFGTCNGILNLTGSGGTAPYMFSVDGGAFQAGTTFNSLCSGPHVVQVRDANGCLFTINTNITTPTAVSVAITNNTPAACGANTGSLTAAGAGGTGAYQYSINGGATFQASGTFGSLASGNYTITVRDANGCTSTVNATVINNAGPVVSVGSITHVTCAGGVNGSVLFNVAGGAAPISYDLNPGPVQASNTFSGLAAGNYAVVVTDGNGCTSTINFTINQPSQLTFVTAVTQVTCNGLCNGQITVNASNATPPYEYSSNGGLSFQPSNILTGLCAGNINVVVRDANGCLANSNVVITQPTALNATFTSVNPLCQGVCNGSINFATHTGGTGVHQYSIDGGALQASTSFTGLCSGPHTMLLQDANGCQFTQTVTLIDPPGYILDTVSTDPSNCGFNDGGFVVQASGGAGGYMYNNITAGIGPQASGTFTNLVAGAYQVTVTDANGCVEDLFVGVNDIQMSGQLNFVTDATCFGICDGTVSTIATGGSGTITYDYDNGVLPPQFGSGDFVGLCPGNHAITMTDQGFCIFVVPFTVNTPANITFSTVNTNITCNGGSDGTITFNLPNGGTAPYQYSINNGASYTATQAFTGLTAGTYTLMVQDANGCTATGTATLTQPTLITFVTNVTNLTCNGNNTGTLQIVAAGGTGGYTYSINNGSTFVPGFSFFGLAANTYNIVVKDNSNCTVSGTAIITEPAILNATTVADSANCFGVCDGSITVTANGGTTTYLYSADNGVTFQTSNIISSLCAGVHAVVVKDANGCLFNLNQAVAQPTQLAYVVNAVNSTCGNANGSLTVNANSGTPTYEFSIDNGTTFGASGTFNGLLAGTYDVIVQDHYGCAVNSTEVVNNDASPNIVAVITTDPLCNGDANGTADVTATGGTGALTYSVDGGPQQASNIITGLAAGPHVITVTDANGCTDVQNINLSEPPVLAFTSVPTNLICFNDFTGSIQVNANGGTTAYEYSFDNGTSFSSSSSNNFIAAGTYDIVVRDAHGCTATGTETVTQPTQLIFGLFNIFNATCNGFCDGAVTAFPSGGTVGGLYNFNWSGGIAGQNQAQASGICAGNYSLIVTDDNGCTIDTIWTITEPLPVVITSVVGTDALCAASCDATITITAPTAVQYSIDGGATFGASNVINALCSGNYNIMVEDATGCQATSNITLYEPTPLQIAGTPDAFICYAGDMTLSALASGGTAPYQYFWDNGVNQQNQLVNPIAQTTYNVFAVDTNGCISATVTTVVDVSPLFYATISPNDTICPGGSTSFTVQGFDGQLGYFYEWNTGDTSATITVTPATAPTTYTVIAKDQCMDYDTLSVTVDFYALPSVTINANNLSGCAPLDVTLYNTTSTPGVNCTWNLDGINISSCDSVQHTFVNPGCYDVSLTVTSAQGCTGDSTFANFICVFANPIADFTWSPQTPTTINAVVDFQDQSFNAATYAWDFAGLGTSTAQNPSFNFDPDTSGNYLVCLNVVSPDGCVDDTCKLVFIADEYLLYVPNAFTPDGDGFNDFFLPIVQALDPNGYNLMIFNRWGELIFESYNKDIGWDGTHKGQESKQDVYVWKIKAKDMNEGKQRVYYGHVSLLR